MKMSRSYRKIGAIKDNQKRGKAKALKRIANSTVRNILRNPDITVSHMEYKRLYESYDIHDVVILGGKSRRAIGK